MTMDKGSSASQDAEKSNEELKASNSNNADENTGSNYGDPEAAKQERQQDNGKKKRVCVECDGDTYRVKNEGDDAHLYESHDKEATLDFAQKLAEEHNVEMVVDDRLKDDREDRNSNEDRDSVKASADKEDSSGEESREGKRFREDRSENEGPRNILVEEEGRYYVVRNEGDHAKLYESTDREATIEFARKVAESHGIDLLVIDRDKRVVTEEKYTNESEDDKEEQE